MNVIKLGKNTYRVYATAPFAVSFLFYVKGSLPTIKRVDGPKEYFEMSWGFKEDMQFMAFRAMKSHLDSVNKAWEIQGELLGALA